MKSFFLLTLTLLITSVVWGQSQGNPKGPKRLALKASRVKLSPKSPPTEQKREPVKDSVLISKTEVAPVVPKSAFNRFSDRLMISYFSAYQGSALGQMDQHPIDEHGKKDTTSGQYIFNQISFNYNFGWKMNFVLNPRFSVNLGNTSSLPDSNNGIVVIEDALMGFQGVIFSSDDKKFNFWMRAGARLPTSKASRAGNITAQPDFYMNPTYDFSKKWQFSSYAQIRHWIYDNKVTAYRYRFYVAPYIQYTINDHTRLLAFYEIYLENRKHLQSQNQQAPLFQNYWQNIMLAVSQDLTKDGWVNFMPFIGFFVDTRSDHSKASTSNPPSRNITTAPLDSAWLGFWFSWRFK
jgi:hypothetical protein